MQDDKSVKSPDTPVQKDDSSDVDIGNLVKDIGQVVLSLSKTEVEKKADEAKNE